MGDRILAKDETKWEILNVRYGASGAPQNAGPYPNCPPHLVERPGAGRVFLAFPALAPGPGRSPDPVP